MRFAGSGPYLTRPFVAIPVRHFTITLVEVPVCRYGPRVTVWAEAGSAAATTDRSARIADVRLGYLIGVLLNVRVLRSVASARCLT